MNNPELIVMFFLIFGGGTMVRKMWETYNNTRVEMARIRSEKQAVGPVTSTREVEALKAEMERLRQEVHSLRDTSTQYDISFDTALTRMESRVTHVERRVGLNASEVQPETITLTGR